MKQETVVFARCLWMGKPMLSCSIPVGRADGRCVDTLEGLEEEAKKFTGYFAMQGADQCGFAIRDI